MSHHEDFIKNDGLCQIIANPNGARVHLTVATEQLKFTVGGEAIPREICPGRALRLDHIMRTRSLRLWRRSLLAFTIAKSVWQFYNSEWMDTIWTHRRIFFVEELIRETQAPILFCKPYLSAKFRETTIGNLEFRQSNCNKDYNIVGAMHHYPIILGLGITLLEIALGEPLDLDESHLELQNAESINKVWVLGNDKLCQLQSQREGHIQLFKKVIERCFDQELFCGIDFVPRKKDHNFHTRRDLLYREIVHPLKDLMDAAITGWEMGDVELIPLDQKSTWSDIHSSQAYVSGDSNDGKSQESISHAKFLALGRG